MRFCILGSGGLGSVIGGYLAKAGEDVTLIGRPAHMEAIRDNGLKISGCRGDFLIKENLTTVTAPDDAEGEFDYLILLVKGKDTATALGEADRLKERVKVVLSLQNGIGKEATLQEWAGIDKVIGASTIEGGTLFSPGDVGNPITADTTAYFGELPSGITPRIEAITDAFNRAGLGARSVEDIMQVLWEKLVQIGTASGYSVTALGLRLFMQQGMLVREGAEHYVALAKDLLKVYTALGYTPENFFAPMSRNKELNDMSFEDATEFVMQMGKRLESQGLKGRTSMHEDVARERKTEVDFILKPFIEKANELGLDIPVAHTVYRIIKTQDEYLNP